jgi:hypothetical protein
MQYRGALRNPLPHLEFTIFCHHGLWRYHLPGTIAEGFNVQKNGGYELEHSYTMDYTAAKILHYLLQIAYTIAQRIHKGSLLKRAFPKGLGSEKNLAYRLLEALRNTPFSKDLVHALAFQRIQIRFCPDTS